MPQEGVVVFLSTLVQGSVSLAARLSDGTLGVVSAGRPYATSLAVATYVGRKVGSGALTLHIRRLIGLRGLIGSYGIRGTASLGLIAR